MIEMTPTEIPSRFGDFFLFCNWELMVAYTYDTIMYKHRVKLLSLE